MPNGVEQIHAGLALLDDGVHVARQASVSALIHPQPSLPRVIYVHGTPGSSTNWLGYLAEPVPGLEPVAIDRPGFGGSTTQLDGQRVPSRTPVLGYGHQAQAIAAYFGEVPGEELVHEPGESHPNPSTTGAILVGHSLGGPIAAMAAAEHPSRVRGLVIVAGSLDPVLEQPRWFNHLARVPPVSWLIGRDWRHANAEVFAAPTQTTILADRLDEVTCRVIIIHGTKDRLVPVDNAVYMQRMLTNAGSIETVLLDGADHFLPWSHAGVIREAVAAIADDRPFSYEGLSPLGEYPSSGHNSSTEE